MFPLVVLIVIQTAKPARPFANGPKITGSAKMPSVAVDGKEFKLDITEFMEKRIRERKDGDKAANEMTYIKHDSRLGASILDFVATGKNQALAIIAYSNLNWSYRSDVNHDLVKVVVTDHAEISLVRSVEMPEGQSFFGYSWRFFFSKRELVLRGSEGFEVLDPSGKTVRRIAAPGLKRIAGLNRLGQLIGIVESPHLGIVIYDLERRKSRSFTVPGSPGPVSVLGYKGDEIRFEPYSGAKFYVNVVTGKVRPIEDPLPIDINPPSWFPG